MDRIPLPHLGYNGVICRYNEIATKGRNRRQFEDLLIRNIRRVLTDLEPLRVLRERGRIFLRPRGRPAFSENACRQLRDRVALIHGLASASPGFLIPSELDPIEAVVCETFPAVYAAWAAQISAPTPIRYSMRARRNDKSFPLTSTELEIRFAERLLQDYPRLQVDLQHAQLQVDVEIREDRTFVSYEHLPGPGGLPAGSGGRALALLSGGIDSPVACARIMKRGCLLDFVTFHSEPYTPPELLAKVAKLVRILNGYQDPGQLLAVNLITAQKVIRDGCRNRYRTLLYRRLMVRLAARAASVFRAGALVTGDNLGQVASQTLQNLRVISAATPMLILRPLLAFDKIETMAQATAIGTLPISAEAIADSCTVFAPANPATAAALAQIESEERQLDIHAMVRGCLEDAVLVCPNTLERTAFLEHGQD